MAMKSSERPTSRFFRRLRVPLFSARGFALRAVELLVLFLLLHLLGIRRYTGFLCGTFAGGYGGAFAGVFYVLLYLTSVVLAPLRLSTNWKLGVPLKPSALPAEMPALTGPSFRPEAIQSA